MNESCANCRFFLEVKKEHCDTIRLCRRVPPLAREQGEYIVEQQWQDGVSVEVPHWRRMGFPQTIAENWCGEWRAQK